MYGLDPVEAGSAVYVINTVGVARVDTVIAFSCINLVVAFAGGDLVLTAAAFDGVIAGVSVDAVVPFGPDEGVVAAGTGDLGRNHRFAGERQGEERSDHHCHHSDEQDV